MEGPTSGNRRASGGGDWPATWSIDPSGSVVEFEARQPGLTINGAFTCVSGELVVDLGHLDRSSARIVIDTSSIETARPGYGALLEARDVMDAGGHPMITFQSRTVARHGDGYRVRGVLRFRSEERDVVVDFAEPEFVDVGPDGTARTLLVSGRAGLPGLVAQEVVTATIRLAARPADQYPAENSPADSGEDEERPQRITILGLVGSYRPASLNQSLMQAAIEEAPEGVEVVPFDLRPVPFYDAELEAAGEPEPVRQLKAAIGRASGLLIATPEYNRGLPARIKNAIDWASRPAFDSVLSGKPVALMGASTGRSGARYALDRARSVLEYTGSEVLPDDVVVARAQRLIDADGQLTDPASRRQIGRLVAGLVSLATGSTQAA